MANETKIAADPTAPEMVLGSLFPINEFIKKPISGDNMMSKISATVISDE